MAILLAVIVVVVVALILGYAPLGVIWALNTLFHLGIERNFQTWLAVVLLWLALVAVVATIKQPSMDP